MYNTVLKPNFQNSFTDEVNDFADQAFQTLKWTFFFLSLLNEYIQKELKFYQDIYLKVFSNSTLH